MEVNLKGIQDQSFHLAGDSEDKKLAAKPTQSNSMEMLHRLRKIAFITVGFAISLMVLGVSYQFIEARADARRFPQDGKFVAVGGHKLNINCTGQGSPTVILESGLSVPAISWRSVQPEIAKFTRVCSYDRSGYDWSDSGPLPRTATQNAKELHSLLQNAGEKPPYLLVGHSFGGTIVRVYSGFYPGEVAGMVLADTGHEDLKFPDSFQSLANADLRRRQGDRKWANFLFWLGISRYMARDEIENPMWGYDQQEWSYFAIQPKFIDATTSELENLDEDKGELRTAGTLGDKPLTVLIAENSLHDVPLSSEEWLKVHKLWEEYNKRLSGLSSRGKWVIVPGSGHMLPFERPQAIVSAVREVYAETNLR